MKIILVILLFIMVFFIFSIPVNADIQRTCVGRTQNGGYFTYTTTYYACFKYIKCIVNGQPMWFIGGLQGELFTNSCPVSISHTAP